MWVLVFGECLFCQLLNDFWKFFRFFHFCLCLLFCLLWGLLPFILLTNAYLSLGMFVRRLRVGVNVCLFVCRLRISKFLCKSLLTEIDGYLSWDIVFGGFRFQFNSLLNCCSGCWSLFVCMFGGLLCYWVTEEYCCNGG